MDMGSDRKVTVITYDEYLALRNSQERLCEQLEEINRLLKANADDASSLIESNKRLENLILEHISREHNK